MISNNLCWFLIVFQNVTNLIKHCMKLYLTNAFIYLTHNWIWQWPLQIKFQRRLLFDQHLWINIKTSKTSPRTNIFLMTCTSRHTVDSKQRDEWMTFTWLNKSCCVFTLCSRVNFKVMLLRFFNLRIDTMSAGAVPLWIIFMLTGRNEVTGKKFLSHLPSFVWRNLTKAVCNKAWKQKS